MIPVHLFGATVDMDPIVELAREAGAHVVEDACQAHGALYRGQAGGQPRRDRAASASTRPRTSAPGETRGAVVTSEPRAGRTRAPAARPRREAALPPPPDRRHRAAWTPCRRRCCDASSTRLDAWNEDAPPARPELRTAQRRVARLQAPPDAIEPDSAAVRGAPTTCTTCSWCAASSATRCATTSRSEASPRRSTTPNRST